MVRYADDAVMAFEDHLSGKRMPDLLGNDWPVWARFVDFRFRRQAGVTLRQMARRSTSRLYPCVGKCQKWKERGRQITGRPLCACAGMVTEWCSGICTVHSEEQHAHLSRMIRGHCAITYLWQRPSN